MFKHYKSRGRMQLLNLKALWNVSLSPSWLSLSSQKNQLTVLSEIYSMILLLFLPSILWSFSAPKNQAKWPISIVLALFEFTPLLFVPAPTPVQLHFQFIWVITWVLSESLRLNERPQTVHGNGISPVCINMWRFNSAGTRNVLSQSSHWWRRLVPEPGTKTEMRQINQ